MNRSFERIKNIIFEYTPDFTKEDINIDSTTDDLNLDSLDLVEIAIAIEEEFKVEGIVDKCLEVKTIKELVNLLE